MSYPGSKGQAGTFQRIIGQMPPHSVYVEPFFGSGRIYYEKLPAERSIINDIDPAALNRHDLDDLQEYRHTKVYCLDALDVLRHMTLPPDSVIYCDPPYLLSTRGNRRYYENEMTDADHHALLTALKAKSCYVMVSGYPSALYSELLSDWRCISYRTRTRGRTLTECLWCNFPEPTELHDWRYAGKNFRERLTLQRQASRWWTRLERMSPIKRGYLLHYIEQRQNGRCVPAPIADSDAASCTAGNATNDAGRSA